MIAEIKSPEGNYEIVRRGEPLNEQFKNEYWRRVKDIMTDVFRSDSSVADDLRKNVDGASPDTQTAFYHADPFEVAADLAGRPGESITPDEKRRYVNMKKLAEPPKGEDLDAGRPEDKP
ncbi:hypothetical protein J6500_07270 [Bradyrhizobium sp. WSM 1704]|uniref:hypothetical protein n=1 Tax=Bradyrhizobium semiaridum TaxID=2821404 RepID=UPI001CE30F2A|nr:hypothetical protein [Bradyrhizobium semiaridum]MCA6121701.1 hypothetical protein [Bradyrhizobium semiaridum]